MSNMAILLPRGLREEALQKEPFPASVFTVITINEGLKLSPNGGHCWMRSLPM